MDFWIFSAYIFTTIATTVAAYVIGRKTSPSTAEDRNLIATEIATAFQGIQNQFRDEFRVSRDEITMQARENRKELSSTMRELKTEIKEELSKSIRELSSTIEKNFVEFARVDSEKFDKLEIRQNKLVETTERKLDQMRETVDEKLQKTLHERIGQSFETVGKHLAAVQAGLGEMKNLAQDVGGLKKVLSNVKMRGGFGEVQLQMLLEQILAPEQFEGNVKTKKGSHDHVEFAVKLPGKDDGIERVWLPIDAKFPKDVYEQLQLAYDAGEVVMIDAAQKNLETTIKKMAKDIRDKYIDPPYTTDFGIMFLPFEGIFAEVVRKASLLEELQRDYKVIVTGPTTLAAILNSLQMGFRTLAIQKRSGEVWTVLGAVKTEFDKFGGMLEKVQQNIQTGLNNLDTLVGTRTNAIKRKLQTIQALSESEARTALPELSHGLDEHQ